MKRRHLLWIASASLVIASSGGLLPARANSPMAPPSVAADAMDLIFLNAPTAGESLVDVPRLAVGVGDSLSEAVVDTGSTGVVLSASGIPRIEQLPTLGPGTITYSSSGRIMRGRWVVTPLVVAGRSGRVVTRPLPILAVDEIACTPTARRCTPEDHPAHVAMLGIGFGREYDHQPAGTPDHNPLLNIAAPAGLPRAYVLSARGIRLGPAGQDFVTVKLTRDVEHQDWSAQRGCITVGESPPSCGNILVDTGITGMFLTVPADRLPDGAGPSLLSGVPVRIDLASSESSSEKLGYAVQAGDPNDSAAPSTIILSGIGTRPTFVNTGVHLLNRFDYLYDADAGVIGYRQARSQQ